MAKTKLFKNVADSKPKVDDSPPESNSRSVTIPKTFSGVVSSKPKILSLQIAVDDALTLRTLTAIVQYDVVDGVGQCLSTQRQKVNLLGSLPAEQALAFTSALKASLTAVVS